MIQGFPPSTRASATLNQGPAWDLMEKVKLRPKYDPQERPEGVINLSGAVNNLMQDWMGMYAKDKLQFEPNALAYGPLGGSQGLINAAAGFVNRFFNPLDPVSVSHVLAANGVTSLINMMAWTLCDEGDGILYTTPNFYMLDLDLTMRNNVPLLPVSTTSLSDPFQSSELVEALNAAVHEHSKVKFRLLFMCNPSNPQGRCYSRSTLDTLASWCARRHMHLVVDEIYAMSTFQGENEVELGPFTSILSVCSRKNVHCLYGLSKDFNMGGVRMGFLVSRNAQVLAAAAKLTWFTWLPVMTDTFVTSFLSQQDTVEEYLATYRSRLAEEYRRATIALQKQRIPYEPANAGLFIFIDLSAWLQYFVESAQGAGTISSPELRLCEYLIDHGIFLNAGEAASELAIFGLFSRKTPSY
uniref:Aminotransferase class I/classII large domain-containing protein n=1 Tax=Bionectria ochroleuca TaxID=29856 RepID=A0A8H7K5Q4_BIOOC